MAETREELIEIIETLLRHLVPKQQMNMVHRSEAARLRLQADYLEQRDADIARAQAVIASHRESQ